MARMRWRQHKPKVAAHRSKNRLLRYPGKISVRKLWRYVQNSLGMNLSKRALRRQLARHKGSQR